MKNLTKLTLTKKTFSVSDKNKTIEIKCDSTEELETLLNLYIIDKLFNNAIENTLWKSYEKTRRKIDKMFLKLKNKDKVIDFQYNYKNIF